MTCGTVICSSRAVSVYFAPGGSLAWAAGCNQDCSIPQAPPCTVQLKFGLRGVTEWGKGAGSDLKAGHLPSCWLDRSVALVWDVSSFVLDSEVGAVALLTLSKGSQPASYLPLTRETIPDSESTGSSTTLLQPPLEQPQNEWVSRESIIFK